MNRLRMTRETPREMGEYALDIGKGALKLAFRPLERRREVREAKDIQEFFEYLAREALAEPTSPNEA